MSYVIHFDRWADQEEEYANLTWDAISSTSRVLADTDQYRYWSDKEDRGTGDASGLTDEELEEKVEPFIQTDPYFELQNAHTPIYNYVHILSGEPCTQDILRVKKYVGNVVIVELYGPEANVIALTTCGMDLTDSIELTYYLMDGTSPVFASHIGSLRGVSEKLLLHCREYHKEHGRITTMEIDTFLQAETPDSRQEPEYDESASECFKTAKSLCKKEKILNVRIVAQRSLRSFGGSDLWIAAQAIDSEFVETEGEFNLVTINAQMMRDKDGMESFVRGIAIHDESLLDIAREVAFATRKCAQAGIDYLEVR